MVATQYKSDAAATATGVAASCLVFLAMGILQALYGPAIPYLLQRFSITPAQAGMALSVHFAGALAGVVLFHRAGRGLSQRTLLAMAYGLILLGCLIVGMTVWWPMVLVGAGVIGLGFGGCDFGLNHLFAVGFGSRSTAMVNLLNGFFGLGSIIAPALIGWLGARYYPALFMGCGVACLVPMALLGHLADHLPEEGAGQGAHAGVPGLMAAFVLIYVLHVGIETGIGGWEPTQLQAMGATPVWAASATAGYWLAFTAGRFLVAILGTRMRHATVMLLGSLGMAAGLMVAFVATRLAMPWLAALAYIGAGLGIAPLFPTGLAWLGELVPSSRQAVAAVIALSMIGGVVLPPGLGALIGVVGIDSASLCMAMLALVCVAATIFIIRRS